MPALRYLHTSSASHGWSQCMGHARMGFPWLRLSTVEFQPQWLMNAAVAPCARISSCGAHPVITSPVPSVSFVNSDRNLACRLSPDSVDMSARSASRSTQMKRCLLPFSAAASSATCSARKDDVVPKDT
uniref:Czog1 n=1 Tax=Arundo donax TaxID=35708 RepID=A0A0A9G2L9_ARUDO